MKFLKKILWMFLILFTSRYGKIILGIIIASIVIGYFVNK